MFNLETLNHILSELQVDVSHPLWVAYSGGLDSHVLLHALCQLRQRHPHLSICAIHVDHGISPHAAQWSAHCLAVCQSLAVPCVLKKIDVSPHLRKNSLEAVARELRYQAMGEVLGQDEYLLTGHHEDDLAETFLLQALRGAGLKGLASMPSAKPFFKGTLLRPFLNISRVDLKQYAERAQLVWIEDESNAVDRFDRNYLRHQILKPLTKRFPGTQAAFGRSARHCAEADQLLDELAQQDFQAAQGKVLGTLSVSALLTLNEARQKNVLRYWIKRHQFLLPSTIKLAQLRQDMLLAKPDAQPLVTWKGAEIRRYDDALYIMAPLMPHDATQSWIWDVNKPLVLPGIGVLKANEKIGAGLSLPQKTAWKVRFRQGGERMHVAGRVGSHPLKKLFQEWGVPTWLRNRIPLIYDENELVMVVGWAVSAHYVVGESGRGVGVLVE